MTYTAAILDRERTARSLRHVLASAGIASQIHATLRGVQLVMVSRKDSCRAEKVAKEMGA